MIEFTKEEFKIMSLLFADTRVGFYSRNELTFDCYKFTKYKNNNHIKISCRYNGKKWHTVVYVKTFDMAIGFAKYIKENKVQ